MATAPSRSGNRSLLAFAATGVALGIGLSVSGSHGLGAWITLAALVLLVFALHRLGRSGPDSPMALDTDTDGDEQS